MNYYRIRNNKLELTNSNYKLQDDWIEYKIGDEPLELEEKLNAQKEDVYSDMLIIEAKQYLNSTDFYYVRLQETGEEVPKEVVAKRKELREFIRANKEEV